MKNHHKGKNIIRFSMNDYDNLPKRVREILANSPLSFGIDKRNARLNSELIQTLINKKVNAMTLRDYGPEHPQVNYNYYPRITRHGVNLEKLNIEL